MTVSNTLNKPIFVKTDSNIKKQLDKLNEIEKIISHEGKEILIQDKKILEAGIYGENQIEFELKNSFIPMYIFHDLNIEYEDLSAQIDYLIITYKYIYIIECKNMIGDIEITSDGIFIRKLMIDGKIKKEGMYSPVTQCKRYVELIKRICFENKEKIGYDITYRLKSYVILANPKTVLNCKEAKEEIKKQIIRLDQLIDTIKKDIENAPFKSFYDNTINDICTFFKNVHKEKEINMDKYSPYIQKKKKISIKPKYYNYYQKKTKLQNIYDITGDIEIIDIEKEIKTITNNKENIINDLKAYRYDISKNENVKPYFVFTNKELEEIINKNPKNIQQFKELKILSETKTGKYGYDILNILDKYRKKDEYEI